MTKFIYSEPYAETIIPLDGINQIDVYSVIPGNYKGDEMASEFLGKIGGFSIYDHNGLEFIPDDPDFVTLSSLEVRELIILCAEYLSDWLESCLACAPVTDSPTASVPPQSVPEPSDGRKTGENGGVGA